MKMKSRKSIVLKHNMKNLMTTLLPMVKKIISDKINQITSSIMLKIRPNKTKKRQNTPKRGMKSLENNFSVKATKNIINTPKTVIEKPPTVVKPEIVTIPKIVIEKTPIATKPKIATKPEIVDRPEIVNKKYEEYKKRVIKQLKKLFDTKKSGYLDDDDEKYKGIRDLEYMFEEVSENDEDYYKPERVKNAFKGNNGEYNYRVYESRGSQYYESLEEYLSKIKPYLENMIRNYIPVGEWKLQSTISIKFISS